MDLASDSFEIEYDGSGTDASDYLKAIRALGFNPRIVDHGEERTRRVRRMLDPIPEPIASALAHAKRRHRPLFVEFRAEWCGPCKVLDETVFPDPAVKKALRSFQQVRVDTDDHPDAGNAFGVTTIPTLLLLDEDGHELGRMAGSIDRAGLLRWLDGALAEKALR